MLTEEKCLKAFNRLNKMILSSPFGKEEIDMNDLKICGTQLQDNFMDDVQVFNQLIEEHFDNPPLKFEELHADMWIWDNFYHDYMQVVRVVEFPFSKRINVIHYIYSSVPFEENRFYRKALKENVD